MKAADVLRIADAAIRGHEGTEAWLEGLCAALRPGRPRSIGAIGYTFRLETGGLAIGECHADSEALREMNAHGLSALSPGRTAEVFGQLAIGTTASRAFGGQLPATVEASWGAFGVRDAFGLIAALDTGEGLVIATGETTLCRGEVPPNANAAADAIRSSMLLRRSLAGVCLEDAADAIFSPDGAVQAVGRKVRALPLSAVREAVRCREAARQLAAQEDASALSVWARLCAGGCRFVDYVDNDGKRFVVLLATEQNAAHALTHVERRIAELCGSAWSNKQIAFALRLTESAVENHVSRVLFKLGLRHRTDLVRLYTGLERAAG
jgi:DNA-binding CsgD family transcriptional regulator